MSKLRWYWIITAGIGITVMTALLVFFTHKQTRTTPTSESEIRPFPSNIQSQYRPLPNENKYDQKHKILTLESNLTGPLYSNTAQIQGDIVSWGTDTVTIDTKGEQVKVKVPPTLRIICYLPVEDGIDMKNVFFFYSKSDRYIGSEAKREFIASQFPAQTNIILLADVISDANMTAYVVSGVGCSETQ